MLLTYAAGLPKKASGDKLLNIPRLFDNISSTGCQIVESFSAFDNLGPIWCQIIESTSPIRQ